MARLFTLDEAIALLPTVRPILEQIIDVRIRLERIARDNTNLHWKARTNGHADYSEPTGASPSASAGSRPAGPGAPSEGRSQQLALRDELNAELARLHDLGVELKDPGLGLVDFPSMRDGRVVNLCWRLGEPTVAYWHALDTGFADRRPL